MKVGIFGSSPNNTIIGSGAVVTKTLSKQGIYVGAPASIKEMKIIAEIGVNHNGSIDIAKNLIVAAKENGADIVKFQTFKAEDNISKYAELADYQKPIWARRNPSWR